MPTISEAQIERMQDAAGKALAKVRSMREEAERTVGIVLTSAETLGATAAMQFYKGYAGETLIGGKVPLDLALGAAGHALALFGTFGKYDEHVHAISNGLLGAWVSDKALKAGYDYMTSKGGPATGRVATIIGDNAAGQLPVAGNHRPPPMSASEVQSFLALG